MKMRTKRIIGLMTALLLWGQVAGAAISANAVWDFEQGGGTDHGGFFVTGATGEDHSQQADPEWDITDASGAGVGLVITTAAAEAHMVGNGLYAVGGTNVTAGWYEIASVVPGTSITVAGAANILTGAGAGDVHVHIGGALDNATTAIMAALIAGNTCYVKSGTFTLAGAVAAGTAGTGAAPIQVIGYKTTHGDTCNTTDRPVLALGAANTWAFANYYKLKNLAFTGQANNMVVLGTYSTMLNCQVPNSSTTAGRVALSITTSDSIIGCEISSLCGTAISVNGAGTTIEHCYIHDGNFGISLGNYSGSVWSNYIESMSGAQGYGIYLDAGSLSCIGNTFRNCKVAMYGKASAGNAFFNNIFADNITGANWSSAAAPANFWDYNIFYANTTPRNNVAAGPHDLATNPVMTAGIVKGTDGVTANDGVGKVFTSATAVFTGVTALSDYLAVFSGPAGVTAGIYKINSVDGAGQITLDTTPGINKATIVFGVIKGTDGTVGAGSSALNAALGLSTNTGNTGTYKLNIGVDQDDNAAGGGSIFGSFVQ